MSYIKDLVGINPVFQLHAEKSNRLTPRMGLARASSASLTTPAKNIVFVADNIPRLESGLRIEPARTNFCGYSTELLPSRGWNNYSSTTELASGVITPLNGQSTAVRAAAVDVLVGVRMLRAVTVGQKYCASFYVKRGSARYAACIFSGYSSQENPIELYLDFDTGQLYFSNGDTARGGAEYLTDGWWRIWLNTKIITNSSIYAGIFFQHNIPTGDNVVPAFAIGDLVGYVTCGQLEFGLNPTSYIHNSSATQTTRAADAFSLKFDKTFEESTIVATYTGNRESITALASMMMDTSQITHLFVSGSDNVPANMALIGLYQSGAKWLGTVNSVKDWTTVTVILSIKSDSFSFLNASDGGAYREMANGGNAYKWNNVEFGKVVHPDGEGYSGYLKNFIVFDKALTKQQMLCLHRLLSY